MVELAAAILALGEILLESHVDEGEKLVELQRARMQSLFPVTLFINVI